VTARALTAPEAVLDFWFGALDEHGSADQEHARRWFTKDPAFDTEIRARFGELHAAAGAGELEAWRESPLGALAYVIVLDQFSRNLYRNDPRAFAGDALALDTARAALARGDDRELALDQRMFLYMPLMHAEDVASQRRCLELFSALLEGAPGALEPKLKNAVDFAARHLAIIERFGRFPHRNAALGRETTEAESEFLKQPGSSF
jgi:uncharacterized protein (DUF924 family)